MGYDYPNASDTEKPDVVCINCNESWSSDDISGGTCPNCGKDMSAVGSQEYWDNYV